MWIKVDGKIVKFPKFNVKVISDFNFHNVFMWKLNFTTLIDWRVKILVLKVRKSDSALPEKNGECCSNFHHLRFLNRSRIYPASDFSWKIRSTAGDVNNIFGINLRIKPVSDNFDIVPYLSLESSFPVLGFPNNVHLLFHWYILRSAVSSFNFFFRDFHRMILLWCKFHKWSYICI